MFNQFNLSCDLMEPFRIIIDRWVYNYTPTVFGKEEKHTIATLLNTSVIINESEQYLSNAIRIYCRSVFEALNDNDSSEISFYSLKP